MRENARGDKARGDKAKENTRGDKARGDKAMGTKAYLTKIKQTLSNKKTPLFRGVFLCNSQKSAPTI